MINLSKIFISIILIFAFSLQINAQQSKIQVALILDTSNSMDGLITQAKTQLWTVVNELAKAKYQQQQPDLQIALYEYGNDNLEAKEGYLRMVSQFTTDLDKISEDLFSLKTNGGSEYCGYVIDKATIQLDWSKSNDDLKMIFIAGNESFTQGNVDYKKACERAFGKGIIINTIFCGNARRGVELEWKSGSDIATGSYLNIDSNKAVAYVETPYDDEITKLSSEINKTYVAYGSVSKQKKMIARQEKQDANAGSVSKFSSVSRSISKNSNVYRNSSWDLVDASEEEDFDIKKIKDSELPEVLQGKTFKEKENYIAKKSEDRRKIKKRVKDLTDLRQAYIIEHAKKDSEETTLGDAMIKVVHEKAKLKNFTFEK